MRGRDIINQMMDEKSNNGVCIELKECDYCKMKGLKKVGIETEGLKKIIKYKCIYCETESEKTLNTRQ